MLLCFLCFFMLFMHIKKHLSESRLFAFYAFCTFLYFFMFFVLFCACRIFSWKRHEITLIPHLYYYSFSIQLKCPTRLKIQPRFSWVYAQFKQDCAISENRGEKVGGKKKADLLSWNFNSQSDFVLISTTFFNMVYNNEAPHEIYPGFSSNVIRNFFFFEDSFISLMGVNSSFLSSSKKFRHQQQQQEENSR